MPASPRTCAPALQWAPATSRTPLAAPSPFHALRKDRPPLLAAPVRSPWTWRPIPLTSRWIAHAPRVHRAKRGLMTGRMPHPPLAALEDAADMAAAPTRDSDGCTERTRSAEPPAPCRTLQPWKSLWTWQPPRTGGRPLTGGVVLAATCRPSGGRPRCCRSWRPAGSAMRRLHREARAPTAYRRALARARITRRRVASL